MIKVTEIYQVVIIQRDNVIWASESMFINMNAAIELLEDIANEEEEDSNEVELIETEIWDYVVVFGEIHKVKNIKKIHKKTGAEIHGIMYYQLFG